ncbi:hypothetical protein BDZ89DRAFT_1054640, partial [Hymenopellis radicata]
MPGNLSSSKSVLGTPTLVALMMKDNIVLPCFRASQSDLFFVALVDVWAYMNSQNGSLDADSVRAPDGADKKCREAVAYLVRYEKWFRRAFQRMGREALFCAWVLEDFALFVRHWDGLNPQNGRYRLDGRYYQDSDRNFSNIEVNPHVLQSLKYSRREDQWPFRDQQHWQLIDYEMVLRAAFSIMTLLVLGEQVYNKTALPVGRSGSRWVFALNRNEDQCMLEALDRVEPDATERYIHVLKRAPQALRDCLVKVLQCGQRFGAYLSLGDGIDGRATVSKAVSPGTYLLGLDTVLLGDELCAAKLALFIEVQVSPILSSCASLYLPDVRNRCPSSLSNIVANVTLGYRGDLANNENGEAILMMELKYKQSAEGQRLYYPEDVSRVHAGSVIQCASLKKHLERELANFTSLRQRMAVDVYSYLEKGREYIRTMKQCETLNPSLASTALRTEMLGVLESVEGSSLYAGMAMDGAAI